jgi:hypothetical protein
MQESADNDFVPSKPRRHKSYGSDFIPSKPKRRISSEQEFAFSPFKPTRRKSFQIGDLDRLSPMPRLGAYKSMKACTRDLHVMSPDSICKKSAFPTRPRMDEKQTVGPNDSPDVIDFRAPKIPPPPRDQTNKRSRRLLKKGLSDPTLNTNDFSFHRTMPNARADRNPATHKRDIAEEFSELFVTTTAAASTGKTRPSLNQYGSTSLSSLSCDDSLEDELDMIWFEVSPPQSSVNNTACRATSYMRRLQRHEDGTTKSKREAFRKGRSKRLHINQSQRTIGSHTTESTATMGSNSFPSLTLSSSPVIHACKSPSPKDGSSTHSFLEKLTLRMNGKLAIEETPRVRNCRK